MKLRLLLADDHRLFRDGLRTLLEKQADIQIVGETSDGPETVLAAHELKPDVILMDINMPKCTGLEAVQTVKAELPQIRIVMLTVSDDDQNLFAAIKSGADGYLLKTIEPHELYEMLGRVHQGEATISGLMANKILHEFRQMKQHGIHPEAAEELTGREVDILECVVQGESNSEIAASLDITENTVKIHLRNILEKLHLQNRIQAAVYAVHQHIVRDPYDI
jgi:DNA-binding NarL/FixJ family response regulator